MDINPGVFKQGAISGEVGPELTSMGALLIGQAFGTHIKRHYGSNTVLIGYDMRPSAQDLLVRVAGGLQAAGCDTYDMGLLATPILQYNAWRTGQAAVMITTEHPNPSHNGFQFMVGRHRLSPDEIQQLYAYIDHDDLESAPGKRFKVVETSSAYLTAVASGFRPTPKLKVIVDAGSTMASSYAPTVLKRLGHDVITRNCTPDANFTAFDAAQPTESHLDNLALAVQVNGAALGLFFNADATQVGVLDDEGVHVPPQTVGRWLWQDISTRYPHADESLHDDLLQGLFHFTDRYFPIEDGIYTAGRIIELCAEGGEPLSQQIEALQESES